MVRYDKGLQHQILLGQPTNPLLLKGFQWSSSIHVPVLWFWVHLEVKLSPLNMLLLRDLWFWFAVSEKQLSILLEI